MFFRIVLFVVYRNPSDQCLTLFLTLSLITVYLLISFVICYQNSMHFILFMYYLVEKLVLLEEIYLMCCRSFNTRANTYTTVTIVTLIRLLTQANIPIFNIPISVNHQYKTTTLKINIVLCTYWIIQESDFKCIQSIVFNHLSIYIWASDEPLTKGELQQQSKLHHSLNY